MIVEKSSQLTGVVKAPPSKSYTQRAIMIGSINGSCKIANPLYADDTLATINACKELGAVIKKESNGLRIRGFYGSPCPRSHSVNVRESGTLLRFILPVIALAKGSFKVLGEKTLLSRSNRTIVEALKSWNISISGQGKDHKLPIKLEGKGEIRGNRTYVSGGQSSQTISSLLIAAPFAKEDTTIIVRDKLVSRPYVDVTIDVLQAAGIQVKKEGYKKFYVRCGQRFKPRRKFIVHGDYSSAAFLIAAASLLQSDITLTDLVDDKQGDKKIINILRKMGAKINRAHDTISIKGPFELKGINIDCGDTPDLVPILAVLGCFAKGKTRIYNISHLAHKESNRIVAPAKELMKLGADISTTKNSIIVKQAYLNPGHVSARGDHRIAMALVIAGLRIGDVKIEGIECISKSYPNFFRDIKSLGVKFRID